MGDPARDEAFARANAIHEQARAAIERQESALGVPPPDNYTTLIVADEPKQIRESLCVAQAAIVVYRGSHLDSGLHFDRLQRLIDECDRLRPVGPDGKHDFRHTPWCGCEVDDLDEPLITPAAEVGAENPSYPSGHPVPRRKGDPILPWRMPWRRPRRKRKGSSGHDRSTD